MPLENDEHTEELPTEVPEPPDDALLSKPAERSSLFIKQEYNVTGEENGPDEGEDSRGSLQINDEESLLSFDEQRGEIDNKVGIIESNYMPVQKQEVIEGNPHQEQLFDQFSALDVPNNMNVSTEEMFLGEHVVETEGSLESQDEEEHFESVFVEERSVGPNEIEEEVQQLTLEEIHEEDVSSSHGSETEEFEVFEGLHVTEKARSPYEQTDKKVITKPISANPRLIRNVSKNICMKGAQEYNTKSRYIVIRQNEKENVAGLQPFRYQKPNPRSILKSSFSFLEDNKDRAPEEHPLEKRILKGKVTTQARLLQNFIAKTTIIHAPIRQERLPRKQTIKPLERQDEEIVVQEVVVSSNGFVTTSEDGILKSKEPLKPTVFLNVSDSDDDYDPRKRSKRKRKHKKQRAKVEIVITDSEEASGVSVIELSDSEGETAIKPEPAENSPNVIEETALKRKRGRTPKTSKTPPQEEKKEEVKQEPPPPERLMLPGGVKQEIKCPKCSKTFPSQGSLQTHMQYHNFRESSLRNAKVAAEAKFKCKECNTVFKNSLQLSKHLNDHRNLGCNICKKIFSSAVELVTHKRSHVKEQMCKTTNPEKLSPKQPKTVRQSIKSPPKVFKCDVCSRIFREAEKLEIHSKVHRKFACKNCGSCFISKLLLDTHVTQDCVKIKSPAKRLSFNVRKSFINSPKRPLKVVTPRNLNLKCDQCTSSFTNYTDMFKHKVAQHGLQTPDKSVLRANTKKTTYRVEHAGVPANNRFKKAFASLRFTQTKS